MIKGSVDAGGEPGGVAPGRAGALDLVVRDLTG
jgi:hypothetical protein